MTRRLMSLSKLVAFMAIILLFSCNKALKRYEVPKFHEDKVLKYTFAFYYSADSTLTIKSFVQDSVYAADCKKHFNILRNGILITKRK